MSYGSYGKVMGGQKLKKNDLSQISRAPSRDVSRQTRRYFETKKSREKNLETKKSREKNLEKKNSREKNFREKILEKKNLENFEISRYIG